jgi:hypothetical protein
MLDVSPKLTANMGAEPTFSVREAAAFLGRSRSWLDQGIEQASSSTWTALWCNLIERWGATEDLLRGCW